MNNFDVLLVTLYCQLYSCLTFAIRCIHFPTAIKTYFIDLELFPERCGIVGVLSLSHYYQSYTSNFTKTNLKLDFDNSKVISLTAIICVEIKTRFRLPFLIKALEKYFQRTICFFYNLKNKVSHDRSAFIILYLLPPTPLFGCGGNTLIPQKCLKVLYITLITCAELRLIALGRLKVMMGGGRGTYGTSCIKLRIMVQYSTLSCDSFY